jgi:hypothetical protein
MIRAMLWKEWREQRWRCVLGTLVLATMAASLVRAQLIPTPEAVLIIFGPLGLLLAIFMAMGSVATERADDTWAFLIAQPTRRATLLRLKWLVGAVNLLLAFLLAGLAAYAAALSRDAFALPPIPPDFAEQMERLVPVENTAGWLWRSVLLSAAAMLAWYTALFFALTRARNELHAGLGGVLLTLAVLAWALQYGLAKYEDLVPAFHRLVAGVAWVSTLFNPLGSLLFVFEPLKYQLLAIAVALLLWTAGPLWLVGRFEKVGRFQ